MYGTDDYPVHRPASVSDYGGGTMATEQPDPEAKRRSFAQKVANKIAQLATRPVGYDRAVGRWLWEGAAGIRVRVNMFTRDNYIAQS